METPINTYIALGSNEGDRLQTLQKAVNAVFDRVGKVLKISPVYETPSWGFEGHDFLNACLLVQTRFAADTVLQKLLEIERDLGRDRKTSGYHNRPIDLDIIYYGNRCIEKPELHIPHPRLSLRKFVLQPLAAIAADFEHPLFKQTNRQLLENTEDSSAVREIKDKLTVPTLVLDELSYLVVEGNIGAGKTSLATMIAQDYNARLITERFRDNPFLPKFYKDQKRYAFPLEMSFLADRYQQLIDDVGQYSLFNSFLVSDYDIYKSLIFAEVTLANDEYQLYKRLFQIMYRDMAKPDLYIYLYQNTEQLLKNIRKRGRDFEQNISPEYLDKINQGYLDFIQSQNHLKTKIIDVTRLDFVSNREDYLFLLKEINKAIIS